MLVIGIDACPHGRWAVVALRNGEYEAATTLDDFRTVLTAFSAADIVAVDIPIGFPLPSSWPRAADVAAREFLGRERKSSVFLTFPREVYEATSHGEAVKLARRLVNVGISIQSYCLGPRMLEADRRLVGRVYEVHPEVSFRKLAERDLPSKKTAQGRAERRACLTRAGIALPERLPRATEGDLLDAAVSAWTAGRIARGEAVTLPTAPPSDDRGRSVAIWY